jgi:hypothetical protein
MGKVSKPVGRAAAKLLELNLEASQIPDSWMQKQTTGAATLRRGSLFGVLPFLDVCIWRVLAVPGSISRRFYKPRLY